MADPPASLPLANQLPATYLHGRRTPWSDAPAAVRDAVAGYLGEPVLGWEDRVGGMSVGLAAVVRGTSRSVFVKGLDGTANPGGQEMYRQEALVASRLPAVPEVPELLAHTEVDTPTGQWTVSVYPALPGDPVRHPWQMPDLRRVLDAWHRLTPALHATPAEETSPVSAFFGTWRAVVDDPDDPWRELVVPWSDRLEAMTAVVDGGSGHPPVLSHLDLRADNVLLGRAREGPVWFVDWAHPGPAAPWADLAILFADVVASGADLPDGGGVDVLRLWREHPATADFDPGWMISVVVALATALHERERRGRHPLFPHRRAWAHAVAEGIRPFLERHTG